MEEMIRSFILKGDDNYKSGWLSGTILAADRFIYPSTNDMDMYMPRINGLGVVKALKSDLFHKYIPVFLVSTASNQELIKETLGCGVSGYLLS